MTLEATFYQDGDSLDYTPAAVTTAGTVVQLPDGTVGVPANDIAAAALGSLQVKGVFKVAAATGTTWSDGDDLWWDNSANQAVKKGATLDGAADFRLGTAYGAKVSGPLFGFVRINTARGGGVQESIVYEFDVQTGVDTDSHILIPASANPNGLLITEIFGIITEVMAGGDEDQGIVTVSDESDNALATLTPTDAGADAIGDIVVGYSAPAASTGAAAKTVAAGEYVDAKVTQVTSGTTPAGKMKVYIRYTSLG